MQNAKIKDPNVIFRHTADGRNPKIGGPIIGLTKSITAAFATSCQKCFLEFAAGRAMFFIAVLERSVPPVRFVEHPLNRNEKEIGSPIVGLPKSSYRVIRVIRAK